MLAILYAYIMSSTPVTFFSQELLTFARRKSGIQISLGGGGKVIQEQFFLCMYDRHLFLEADILDSDIEGVTPFKKATRLLYACQ